MISRGRRSKVVKTLLGNICSQRSLYVCPGCGASCFPGDRALDIESTGFSPGVRRLMARAGSRTSFADAESDLAVYARMDVNRRDIERITEELGRNVEDWLNHQDAPTAAEPVPIMYVSFDGTSAPMRCQELEGRTQTVTDKKGAPQRDEQSTTYVGGIESSTLFGERIYQEAVRRGVEKAKTVVALTDGAAYNKTIIQTHFPEVVHIIDPYHAREHLHVIRSLPANA